MVPYLFRLLNFCNDMSWGEDKALPRKKVPSPCILAGEIYQRFIEEIIPILSKLVWKIEQDKTLPTSFNYLF